MGKRTTGNILGRLAIATGASTVPALLVGGATEYVVNTDGFDDDKRHDWHALLAFGATLVITTGIIFAILLRASKSKYNEYARVAIDDIIGSDVESNVLQGETSTTTQSVAIPARRQESPHSRGTYTDPLWAHYGVGTKNPHKQPPQDEKGVLQFEAHPSPGSSP